MDALSLATSWRDGACRNSDADFREISLFCVLVASGKGVYCGPYMDKPDSLLPRNHQIEPVWDCKQAAKFLQLHPLTVKRMARAGQLPGFRIGNRWRFRPSDLDTWARPAVSSPGTLRR